MSEKQQQFAYQEAAELASLAHLRKLGVQIWVNSMITLKLKLTGY
jgi:hypothetical protein